jgi:hypothetical protein
MNKQDLDKQAEDLYAQAQLAIQDYTLLLDTERKTFREKATEIKETRKDELDKQSSYFDEKIKKQQQHIKTAQLAIEQLEIERKNGVHQVQLRYDQQLVDLLKSAEDRNALRHKSKAKAEEDAAIYGSYLDGDLTPTKVRQRMGIAAGKLQMNSRTAHLPSSCVLALPYI